MQKSSPQKGTSITRGTTHIQGKPCTRCVLRDATLCLIDAFAERSDAEIHLQNHKTAHSRRRSLSCVTPCNLLTHFQRVQINYITEMRESQVFLTLFLHMNNDEVTENVG